MDLRQQRLKGMSPQPNKSIKAMDEKEVQTVESRH